MRNRTLLAVVAAFVLLSIAGAVIALLATGDDKAGTTTVSTGTVGR